MFAANQFRKRNDDISIGTERILQITRHVNMRQRRFKRDGGLDASLRFLALVREGNCRRTRSSRRSYEWVDSIFRGQIDLKSRNMVVILAVASLIGEKRV